MNKAIKVWGRDFELRVIFDTYDSEEITDIQKEALDTFIDDSDELLSSCEELKEYCMKNNSDRINGSIENIFKYVIPVSIYIERNKKKRVVSLLESILKFV